ncbi:radical SAM family heme chaperone HemW [Pseudidiomarina mangrovi]|uniref:radical SAM family heme chaperone HemW n=1 Tax=Pseudidiomarina mangrovi TaxID=2487133 RepID=UPI000FCADF3D|nr:radical SAM family heme chaperone HemW [Pseudidiomarina mangrovi]CAI8167994.1 MAG: Oxygen-independent coproporphyrinogen-III oxidase-like protein YqeR [Pseudidiomarina mangrovi]
MLPPLALYIHVPWCIQKCPYCDFNSHALKQDIPEQAYINRLLDDLRADLADVQQRPLNSIFIGGGTPSLLSADAINRLLQGVQQLIPLAPNCEITLEANPGTFEIERFAGYVRAGVTRLSIGVQSLSASQLQRLGRIHDPEQARLAAKHAGQLGLNSFNLDLMHGLPEQTLADAMADLDGIIALQPPHISWYQLTIEPNTAFASRPPQLPDDDILWDIQQQGHDKLIAAGYQQYEVSAYAKPGHQSKHNRNYWEFGDYLGIGCGAHSKITVMTDNGLSIRRCEKIKHPQGYLDLTRPLRYRSWTVAEDELPFEFFMNYLRLFEAIPKQLFVERTGLELARAEQALASAKTKQLIDDDQQYWHTTELGRRYLNSILDDMVGND